MKTLLILLTTILLVSCSNTRTIEENRAKYGCIAIELPEEINLISTDAKHPDLLVGYKSNDTLHIGYSISNKKLRDYQLDITEDICYIYDGNRLVGKCTLDSNLLEQLITIDNQ